ncbi:unnamed protein product [Amoebophrya sp. A120]|nr:unnamed protein product [Amoebophrya sp. A120]|eukprot:GSA120T00016084001.1
METYTKMKKRARGTKHRSSRALAPIFLCFLGAPRGARIGPKALWLASGEKFMQLAKGRNVIRDRLPGGPAKSRRAAGPRAGQDEGKKRKRPHYLRRGV